MSNNNLKQKGFLKDSSIYSLSSVISAGIVFITLPIYTRFLSPADYGIIALFIMFGQISSSLLSIGLQSASYRYYFKYNKNIEVYKSLNFSILIFLLFVYLLGGVGIYYLADWFSSTLFDSKITGKLIRWSFLSGCMEYLFYYFSLILTAQSRSVTFSVITISRAIIRTAFSFYFIFMYSLTYLAMIYAILLTQGIMVISLLFLTGNLLGIQFSSYHLKKSLRFSYPMVLRIGIGAISTSFDKVMLTNFTGLISVGYYSIADKFANLLKLIMDAVGKVWNPFFLIKAHENTEEAKKAIVSRYIEITFFFMLVGFVIICFSEEAIKLLTTSEYYPAMYITPLFTYYYIIGITSMLSIPQIQFSEKTLSILPASIVGVTLNITLNIFLIPKFGAIGAVVALTISNLLGNMVRMYFGFRVYPLPLKWWKLVGMYLVTLAFVVPIYPIMASNMNFLFKIVVKLLIILLFVITSLKLNYISKENIRLLFSKMFPKLMIRFSYQKT